jgi:NTP pyrophosphatase (non-canonical NTP hydrolase)
MADLNQITEADIEEFCKLVSPGNTLDEYQRIATKTAIYPGKGTPLGLEYTALKGAGEAGEFAEHVGKAMRDDNLVELLQVHPGTGIAAVRFNELTPGRRDALIKEVGDQLWYLSAKCNELGISLSGAALLNLQKLCSRTQRGKLQGSGDNR